MAASLLACDWGTTNLRAWTLDAAGAVVTQKDLALGVSTLAPGEAARRFEGVEPGADHLHGLIAGKRAQRVDEIILADQLPQPVRAHLRQRTAGVADDVRILVL